MYDYNRGAAAAAYDDKEDHKKHIGAAVVLTIFSVCWMWAYAHYLKVLNDNFLAFGESECCTWTNASGDVSGPYLCAEAPPVLSTKTNVTAEFHDICACGVALMTILLVVALGHCIKPLRCFTKIFGSLIWVAYISFFIAANVYRFRDSGRICSLDYTTTSCIGTFEWCTYEGYWLAVGTFQRRALIWIYILGAVFAVIGCLAACCHKRKQRNMY